jgi:hypothetical protein
MIYPVVFMADLRYYKVQIGPIGGALLCSNAALRLASAPSFSDVSNEISTVNRVCKTRFRPALCCKSYLK